MTNAVRIVAAVAALSVGAAFVPAAAEPQTAHVHVVDGGDPFFDPFEAVIRPGDTVEWDNHADRLHTVTHVLCKRADARNPDGQCEFDTVFDLAPGTAFEHTFDAAGTFDYKCTIHNFTGRITVLSEDGALPDLVVEDLAAFDTPVPTNRRLQATVRNVGPGPAVGTKLRFQYQNVDETWIDIGEVGVPPLNADASVTLNQQWLVANKMGDFPVRAIGDVLGTAIETDEDNNITSVVIAVWLPAGIARGVALPEPP